MIKLTDVIVILIAHYIGDFICQSRPMADNKSKNIYWLLTHGTIYSAVMFVLLLIFSRASLGIISVYILINGVLHTIVDKFSSMYSTKFYQQKRDYNMFCIIGGDQLLHYIILLLTAYWLLR